MPSFDEERLLQARGYRYIAGVDEVGRGALAGPVVAAAVVLPIRADIPFIDRVRDSKKLTPGQREKLYTGIYETALAVGVGISEHEVIDRFGIVRATRLAMHSAIEQLSPPADSLLIDYMYLPEVRLPQKGIVRGDDASYSIACASIIAKVFRDRLMVRLDGSYSGYGLAAHKGYCTAQHVECLMRLGPSPIHRVTFNPVREMIYGKLL
jgi:ribonuclease HII